jgi:tetratricopeptide (TPR) repeat protein
MTPEESYNRGVALFEQGNFKEAIKAFNEAIKSNDTAPHSNLGRLHFKLGNLEGVIGGQKFPIFGGIKFPS